jgi:hypothetical protein
LAVFEKLVWQNGTADGGDLEMCGEERGYMGRTKKREDGGIDALPVWT